MCKLKSMEEALANPDAATPMEVACATLDILAESVRGAVERGDLGALLEALDGLDEQTAMIRRWLQKLAPPTVN